MQSGWCLICGAAKRHEFARQGAEDFSGTSGQPDGIPVRFVICSQCGHVYQDPMLTADDVTATGGGTASRQALGNEMDLVRFQGFEEWAASRLQVGESRRSLLHIGTRALDEPGRLASEGWSVVELPLGLDSASGMPLLQVRDIEGALSGRTFSLILFSAIEQLADPVPLLRALRPHVDDDGWLAIMSLNLLAPPSSEHLLREFISVRHMRLYSLNSLQTILARSGFRAEAVTCLPGGLGIGALARRVEWEPDHPYDDPDVIRRMYNAFGWPGSVDALGWNLAALAEHQPLTLSTLCRQMENGRYFIRRSGRHVVGLIGMTADGEVVPIARWGHLDGNRTLLQASGLPPSGTIVQMGLGTGELAEALAQRLTPSQHLLIWEADPTLARTVLEAVDLSALWNRSQVSLLLGEVPLVTPEQQKRMTEPSAVYSTDAARRWTPHTYRHLLGTLNVSDIRHDPVRALPGDEITLDVGFPVGGTA